MTLPLRPVFYIALHHPDEKNHFSLFLNLFLASMVLLNIMELVWMSIPEYGDRYLTFAALSQNFFVLVFASEYALRVWSAAENSRSKGPRWNRRWIYIRSPMGLVDLLSFLPILLLWLMPNEDLGDMRMLKLIAIVRIIKLTRYSDSLAMLARLYHDNKNSLFAAAMVMMILSFMAATGIYYFEREAQPELFGSIPDCMWWALVTLTTVGYGDMVPGTAGGQIFGVLVMISGVGIAAMPAGIFASSFVQLVREQERQKRRNLRRKLQKQRVKQDDYKDEAQELHFYLSRSEQREVDYLAGEFALSFEQAVDVVMHYRH